MASQSYADYVEGYPTNEDMDKERWINTQCKTFGHERCRRLIRRLSRGDWVVVKTQHRVLGKMYVEYPED